MSIPSINEYCYVVKLADHYHAAHIRESKITCVSNAFQDIKTAQAATRAFAEDKKIAYNEQFKQMSKPAIGVFQLQDSWYPAKVYPDRISLMLQFSRKDQKSARCLAETIAKINRCPYAELAENATDKKRTIDEGKYCCVIKLANNYWALCVCGKEKTLISDDSQDVKTAQAAARAFAEAQKIAYTETLIELDKPIMTITQGQDSLWYPATMYADQGILLRGTKTLQYGCKDLEAVIRLAKALAEINQYSYVGSVKIANDYCCVRKFENQYLAVCVQEDQTSIIAEGFTNKEKAQAAAKDFAEAQKIAFKDIII